MTTTINNLKDAVWYLAGPMSGIDKFNIPMFLSEKERLEKLGYTIQLPADLHDPEIVEQLLNETGDIENINFTWAQALGEDVKIIGDKCDGVMVLPGWETSKGARLETFLAYVQQMPIIDSQTLNPIREEDLEKAWMNKSARTRRRFWNDFFSIETYFTVAQPEWL